jgi:hypothetical protein
MYKEHDMPMARHYGKKTTRVAVGKKFYWFEMK